MKTNSKRSLIFIIAGLALVGGLAFWYWPSVSRSLRPHTQPLEKITISTSLDAKSALLYLAQHNGYFSRNGVDVTLKFFPSGKMGCEQMQAGQVDIANIADFVLVDRIFAGASSLRCVGAIAAADDHQLIILKSRGIATSHSLKGKSIGVPSGTSAAFFLGRFLAFNDLRLKDVAVVDINPTGIENALANSRVDAVLIWERWAENLKKHFRDKITVWPGQSGQKYYWLLVTTDDLLQARPRVLEPLFRALHQAEIFLRGHAEEAVKIVARRVDLDPVTVKAALARSRCALSFEQSLLLVMEDEARWIIRNNLTGQSWVPNYLDYMNVEALSKVNPQAVRLIVPKPQQ
jgi:ABC-type nitrate/sulfonate/bicarbonate transport system substrate-binding protein